MDLNQKLQKHSDHLNVKRKLDRLDHIMVSNSHNLIFRYSKLLE